MKKLLAFLLSAIMIFACFNIGASAATVKRETEENGTIGTATTITDKITGNVKDEYDIDYYKFNATKDYFVVKFGLNSNFYDTDLKGGWDVIIYDKDHNEIDSFYQTYGFTSQRLPMTGTVYIKVVVHNSYAPTEIDYDLTVTQTTDAYRENEYNDSKTTACQISTNKTYTGNLYKGNDTDYYKLNITGDYFVVNFKNNIEFLDADSKHGWDVTIYDKDFNQIDGYYQTYGLTSQRLPITGTIYIKIVAHHDDFAPTEIDYDLTVTETTDKYWESEYNNSARTANKIAINKTYTGSLYYVGDVDYYKVDVTGDYFFFDIEVADEFKDQDLSHGWTFTIYDKDLNIIDNLDYITNRNNPRLAINGTIYIKINATHTDYAPDKIEYKIKVTQKTDSTWENESNDNTKTATPIKKDINYGGTLYNSTYGGDVDYYKMSIVADGTINLNFSQDRKDDDRDGFKIELKDNTGTTISQMYVNDSAKNSISNFKVTKGTYYVHIIPSKTSEPPTGHVSYTLSYTFKLKKPSFKTVVSDKTSIKATWGKKNYVDGYELEYSTNKNFKKATRIKITKASTATRTIKKLAVNKKFYFRIRTFKKIDKKTNYSAWSSTKSATTYKLATPSLKKVASDKQSLNITLKKQSGIDSYRIQYSKNKTFKSAKTVTVAKNKTTATIKKLTANKKYYVRLRTVKKLDGVNKYSEWSKSKSATTYKLATPSFKKVSGAKKTLSITLKKQSGIDSYQVQYSKNKTFKGAKTITVAKNKTTAAVKKLTANKKYYVRVRTVKKVDSVKRYSAWSKAKNTTIKK